MRRPRPGALAFVFWFVLAFAAFWAVLVLGLLAVAVAPGGGYFAASTSGPAISYGIGAVTALVCGVGAAVAAWRTARRASQEKVAGPHTSPGHGRGRGPRAERVGG